MVLRPQARLGAQPPKAALSAERTRGLRPLKKSGLRCGKTRGQPVCGLHGVYLAL